MPGLAVANLASTFPFRPVTTSLFNPGPTRRIRAPAIGLPAALSVSRTPVRLPAGTVRLASVSFEQNCTGFGFGFTVGGVSTGGVAGRVAGGGAGGVTGGVGGVAGGVGGVTGGGGVSVHVDVYDAVSLART